ncbi:acetyl-CoA carboxylase carboxyltransferase subunit alpha, partial [Rhizobium sp. BR5]
TGDVIAKALADLSQRSGTQLRAERRQKFLDIGRNL